MADHSSDKALVACFRQQLEAHERLRHEHERVTEDHAAAVRRAEESERALEDSRRAEARSAELIAAMQETIERFVSSTALSGALDEANGGDTIAVVRELQRMPRRWVGRTGESGRERGVQ